MIPENGVIQLMGQHPEVSFRPNPQIGAVDVDHFPLVAVRTDGRRILIGRAEVSPGAPDVAVKYGQVGSLSTPGVHSVPK